MSVQQTKPANQYEPFNSDQQQAEYNRSPPVYSHPQQVNVNIPQVATQPNGLQSFTVETHTAPWTWCHLITAMISFFCCQPFGLIATVMSILSYVDHRGNDFEKSRAKRSVSFGFGITAIVLGCIIFLIYIIVIAVAAAEVTGVIHDAYNSNDFSGFDGNK